jgi:hypothetical protein
MVVEAIDPTRPAIPYGYWFPARYLGMEARKHGELDGVDSAERLIEGCYGCAVEARQSP